MEKEENDVFEGALKEAQGLDIIEDVMIQTVTTQMSFSSMMNGLENGDYIIPGFQRLYRWTEAQVEELAISLVRGMPIPPIYCYRNEEQQFVILDGQQRTLSLYFYYIGKFLKKRKNAFINAKKITNSKNSFKECLESYDLIEKKFYMRYQDNCGLEKEIDITYDTLSSRLKRRIDFSPITLIEIKVDSEKYKERTLHKIFANLNIGGKPLSSQELRNGIYECKFYDMLYDINDYYKKWRELYSGNAHADINKESKDVELLLQMCAFKFFVKGEKENFILTEYKGKIGTLLDVFSEIAREFSDEQINIYKNALISFFESLEGVNGKNKHLALVSLFVAWERMKEKPYISNEKYVSIINNEEYKSTITEGTSRRSEIEKRLKCVYEQLSKDDKSS